MYAESLSASPGSLGVCVKQNSFSLYAKLFAARSLYTSQTVLPSVPQNPDPSAKRDLERWLNRLVPEGDPFYSHTTEGPDDMPAHIKAALTQTNLSIPITGGRLALGAWQGIYLWEHRHVGSARRVVVHVGV